MVEKEKRLKVMVVGSLMIVPAFSFLSEVSKGGGVPFRGIYCISYLLVRALIHVQYM